MLGSTNSSINVSSEKFLDRTISCEFVFSVQRTREEYFKYSRDTMQLYFLQCKKYLGVRIPDITDENVITFYFSLIISKFTVREFI